MLQTQRWILSAWVMACVTAFLPMQAQGAAANEALIHELIEEGFENVHIESSPGLTTIWFENRIYRNELTSIGVVAILAGKHLDKEEAVLELIPLNRGVSLLSISAQAGAWFRFLQGESSEATFRTQIRVLQGERVSGESLRAPGARNASRLRTDLALRPLFGFRLGLSTDTFLYTAQIAPEATMSPFYGGLATVQAGLRIHDDLDPCGKENPCGSALKPVRNTLSWGGWLPDQWLLAVSGGVFPGDRYGFLAEVGRLYLEGQLELWGGGELTGRLQFLEDVIQYSSVEQWVGFGAATYRMRKYDLETTVKAGRFREEKLAVRADVERRFGEFEIGFFVVKNEDEDVGGMTLRIALPVERYRRPSRLRLTTVPAFPFTYRESVDPAGVQTSMFDNLDRLRKRLYPPYIRNNVKDLRTANRYVGASR